MTTQEYRKHPACNFSNLKHLLTSPAHYQAAVASKIKETRDMMLGTLCHAIALEGASPESIYAFKPENMSLTTTEGKKWKSEQKLKIVDYDMRGQALSMVDSVMANPNAAHILSISPDRETPILANIRGVECKALLDTHGTDGQEWWIADLKTTDDASPDAFARKVANYHYDLQAELYGEILARHHQIETRPFWLWIVVEKFPPYTCAVYNANEWRESGEAKLEQVLTSWKECNSANNWPQPWQGINTLPKPKWA